MTPLKPYMVRALYDWIVDNGLTPYLLVDAMHPAAILPQGYEQDGRIILNVRPEAVQQLHLGDDHVGFNARFGGRPMRVEAPMAAILALYARENGRGMVFEEEETAEAAETSDAQEDMPSPPDNPEAPAPARGRPHLTVVK